MQENSGKCGENLTWEFDKLTGTLTISGTGAMDDFSSYSRPWFSYEDTKIGQGREAVKKMLADNPELCEEIESKIVAALKEER